MNAGEAALEVGVGVWVADANEVWKPGVIVGFGDGPAAEPNLRGVGTPKAAGQKNGTPGGGTIVVEVRDGAGKEERVEIPRVAGQPMVHVRNDALKTRQGVLAFNDLSHLPLLHEPALLHALQVRFEESVVYTLTGPVLLAVNPFRQIPNLYGPERLRAFADRAILESSPGDEEKTEPHIFAVATSTFQKLWHQAADQTVLISGESGAGKTETTKFVMRFLALAGAEGGEPSTTGVERQVLGSIPLLEALGNAKTLRNNNSSRFGKYIELQFGRSGKGASNGAVKSQASTPPRLVGAHTHTYLLEKVRVTGQQRGERSFHIFYQMLAAGAQQTGDAAEGCSAEQNGSAGTGGLGAPVRCGDVELRGIAGHRAEDFEYLRKSECFHIGSDGADEAAHFRESLAALSDFGVPSAEASDLLASLAAVLHLGNVEFKAPANNSEGSEPTSLEGAMRIACELLAVDPLALKSAWCYKTMKAPGERIISTPLPIPKAAEGRDALARHLYAAIFSFVVQRVNAVISVAGERQWQVPFIGVLDIFGFEFFQTNSLEQLFINYTNELLQKHFNEVIFEYEAELYMREGIQWDPLAFPDNNGIVDMIGKPPQGLLPLLDEECMIVGGSSERWCRAVQKHLATSPHFKVVLRRQEHFVVRHFAGDVEYASQSFLAKNRDVLSADLIACMKASGSSFIQQRFIEHDRAFGVKESTATSGSRRVAKARVYTVANEFRDQLHSLMKRIRLTEPHFVRCIKPNPQSLAGCFNRRSVAEQLNYQGVLQAIEVSRAGFPLRFRHRQGTLRFRCLAKSGNTRLQLEAMVTRGRYDQAARLLLGHLSQGGGAALPGLQASDWAVGTTLVFFKRRAVELLGGELARERSAAAVRLQATWRRHVAQRRFREAIAAVTRLQSWVRATTAKWRAKALRRERTAVRLQCFWRGRRARVDCRELRRAVLHIQAWLRACSQRAEFLRTLALVVRLQRWSRRTACKLRAKRRWRAAVAVQRTWRGAVGRFDAQQVAANRFRRVRAARRLLCHWRGRVCDRLLPELVSRGPRAARGDGATAPATRSEGADSPDGGPCANDHNGPGGLSMGHHGLDAAGHGELLAALAALSGRVRALDRDLLAMQKQRDHLVAQVVDHERWTFKGILVRVAGKFFGDNCGPRAA